METSTGIGNIVVHTEAVSGRKNNAKQGLIDTNKKPRFPIKWDEEQVTVPEIQEGLIF